MSLNVAALVDFLNSLPIISKLPTGVKKFLGDVITVAVALVSVLAVVAAVGPTLHLGATDQSYIVAASSVLSAVIALLRRQVQATAAAQKAAGK